MKRLWGTAWLLLAMTNVLWAGNIVLARGVAGQIPPIAMAYYRWTGAFLVSLPFAWPMLRRDAHVIRRNWRMIVVLAASGIAIYNAMVYVALVTTSALNVLLLQSANPLIILIWTFLLFRERPSLRQALGVLLSLCGVAAIASRGSLITLIHLQLNRGDAIVLVAVAIYAFYCAVFRRRPAMHPLSLLTAIMGIGSCMILPFFLWERMTGGHIIGGIGAYLALAYMAVFPSFIAYFLFNRGIDLIGASLAGQSTHLMPLFGSLLAVVFLGERFHSYHLVGIALIGAGILLASVNAARTSGNRQLAETA